MLSGVEIVTLEFCIKRGPDSLFNMKLDNQAILNSSVVILCNIKQYSICIFGVIYITCSYP